MADKPENPEGKLFLAKKRREIYREIRLFFETKNYLEIETPLLAPDLIPESCLEVFETKRLFPGWSRRKENPLWLAPSPEIWMKKFIAEYKKDIFQIGKCFRNGESTGFLHNPEFTMLEYYTIGADYMDSLVITENLFSCLLKKFSCSGLEFPFERLSVNDAFKRWAGFDLFEASEDIEKFKTEAEKTGINIRKNSSLEEIFDLVFIHAVEPNMPHNSITALVDYPAFVPCLAKKNNSGKSCERWELYSCGIELANCFSEENDAANVRDFFAAEKSKKEKNAIIRHKTDDQYWKLFENENFPKCSGVAMGLDRLIMILCGCKNIEEVLLFPENSNF